MLSRFKVAGALCACATMMFAVSGWSPDALRARQLDPQQRQRMYQQVKPAVVLVQVQIVAQIQIDLAGQRIAGLQQTSQSASGWFITPDGHLVTTGHVAGLYLDGHDAELERRLLFDFIRENHVAQVQQHFGRALSQEELVEVVPELVQRSEVGLVKNLQVVLQNGDRYMAEVRRSSPGISPLPGRISFPGTSFQVGKDVAVLKIEGRNLPVVPIGDPEQISPGDEVYVAGYPDIAANDAFLNERTQVEPSFTRGSVSGVEVPVAGVDVMQIDAPTTWGHAGGPVFNGRGEVVGMATFGSLAPATDGSAHAIQGFNFAVPTSTIMAFVRSEGIGPTTGLFNRTWAAALNAYHAEQWDAAVDALDDVLRVYAGLPDAVELRSAAVAQRAEEPTVPWTPALLVASGVLVLVGMGLTLRGSSTGGAAHNPLSVDARLVVAEGSLKGTRFDVPASGLKIGRDPASCQVVLRDAASSREHAMIYYAVRTHQPVVRNLSGTNPTYLNGRPIQEAVLSHGDRIRIAGSVLAFEIE
jgi:S1-C subfamily serine protease